MGPEDFRLLGAAMRPHRDAVVDRIVSRTLGELATYERVPEEDLRARTLSAAEQLIAGFERGTFAPAEDDSPALEDLPEIRAAQGVSMEDLLRSVHIYAQEFVDLALRLGTAAGIPRERLLDWVVDAMGSADATVQLYAREYRVGAEDATEAQLAERGRFLSRLFAGALPPAELRAACEEFELDSGERYHAIVARSAHAHVSTLELAVSLTRRLPTTAPGIVGSLDQLAVAVCTEPPYSALAGTAVGLGGRASLMEIDHSYAEAEAAAAAAVKFRRPGIHSVENVAALIAVSEDSVTGDAFERRWLAPLAASRDGGALIAEALDAWFEAGMRVDPAAERLYLHPNSLRKRLTRFQELTGADLSRIDDLFGIWWALRRRQAEADDAA